MQDERLNRVIKFMTGMTEIKIHRHPMKEKVKVAICKVNRDHYGDSTSEVETIIDKEVIIQKNVDLSYINITSGVLLDDGEHLPWIMILTLKDLPRTLQHGDYVTYDEFDYKVSGVKPVNRENPDIIMCFLHPDRIDFELQDQIPIMPLL